MIGPSQVSELNLDVLSGMTPIFSTVMTIFGLSVVVVGLIMVARGFFGSGYGSPMSGISVIVMGGLLMFFPMILRAIAPSAEYLAEPSASPSPSPPAEVVPDPAPAPAPDPIVLPEIQNWGFIVLLVVILAALAAGIPLATVGWRKLNRVRAEDIAKKLEIESAKAKLLASWSIVTTTYEKTLSKYLEVESDWNILFSAPSFVDPGDAHTAAMLEAMRSAGAIDPSMPDSFVLGEDPWKSEYGRAVQRFSTRMQSALRHAKQIGTNALPADERKRVQEIRKLLDIAENHGSSINEREIAYGRAMSLIRKLKAMHLPEKAFLAVEQKFRLAIEAGPSGTPDGVEGYRQGAIAL